MINRREFLKSLLGAGGLVLLDNPIIKAKNLENIVGSILTDPNGPHSKGAWLNGGVNHPWPSIYGHIGPNGNSSKWTIINWGDLVDWPTNYKTDGYGGFIINHPIAGYLRWYRSPRGGYGLEVSKDTTLGEFDNNNYSAEHNDGLIPNPVAWNHEPLGVLDDKYNPILSRLNNLKFRAWQQVIDAYQGNRNEWDYVNTSLITIFWNETKRQNLWWYIYTYDSRGVYPDATWNEVGCQYEAPADFRGGEPFYENIVIDGIQNYENRIKRATPLVPGRRGQLYMLNILPRVIDTIKNAPAPDSQEKCIKRGGTGLVTRLDTNLDNWKIDTIFVGSIIGGEGRITSRHDSINLSYKLK